MERLHSKTKSLEGIQTLRGFAVSLVVLSHFAIIISPMVPSTDFFNIFISNSPFGVDLFFFISGFIIVYTTQGNIPSGKIRAIDFSIKRVLRIVPVYLFCLLLHILFVGYYDQVMVGKNLDVLQIVKSIFLIPLNPSESSPAYGFSLLIPAWTLTYEMYFYTTFAISLFISSRYRSLVCSVIIIALLASLQLSNSGSLSFDAQSVYLNNDSFFRNVSFLANPIVFDFIIGMIVAELFLSKLYNKFIPVLNILSPVLLCIGLAMFVSMFRYGNGIINGGLGALLIFVSILHYDFSRSTKYPKPLTYLGDISYSFYISHVLTISICDRYSNLFYVYTQVQGWRRYCVVILISLAVSIVLRMVIEKPSAKISKYLVGKLKNSTMSKSAH
ncbi:TPA: acyltransferase [Enterobacter hormaechei subsp. steigerwaltii]|nr:acyltransferase [Enterobacter hormaechei subsp. steigerwaltii]HCM9223321.1 acyltransferase [Enterobacter hormaechei subsp. steigerwaltii]